MVFKKLDEYTVQCILSEDEIREEGLELDDFFENRSKVREFLEKLVARASEEVGYHLHGNAIAMQISPASEGQLSITFSEKTEEGLMKMIEQVRELLAEQGEDVIADVLKSLPINSGGEQALNRLMERVFAETDQTKTKQKQKASKAKKSQDEKGEDAQEKKTDLAIFSFYDWNDLEGYCMILPTSPMVKSWLYKEESKHRYYLVLEPSKISLKDFQKLCVQGVEYGEYESDHTGKRAFLKEHCKAMIKKRAVDEIQKLVLS